MRKIRRLYSILVLSILLLLSPLVLWNTLSHSSPKDLSPFWNSSKTKIYPCYADDNLTLESPFYSLIEAQRLYNIKKYKEALEPLDVIINNYADRAQEIQNSLQEKPWMSKEDVFRCRELNAVGAALVTKGLIYIKLKDLETAEKLLNEHRSHYAYSDCWNPSGWFVGLGYKSEELLDEIHHRQGKK